MTIPIHHGMAAVAADYDAFIIDLWGVVHDGVAAFDGVIDCLTRLRQQSKHVVILSNAPRRAHKTETRLGEMAIPADSYSAIVTSGEAGRLTLAQRSASWTTNLGKRFFHIGKDADGDLLDGLDYQPVETLEDADFLLLTGTTEADDETLLRRAADLGLAVICVNPDLAVIQGGTRVPCAGAHAALYENLGGTVHRIGKPFADVYSLCFEIFGDIDRSRILVIGDGLTTDIRGAVSVGLDSLLVTGGLLADQWGVARTTAPDQARLDAAYREAGVTPTAVVPAFTW